MSTVRDNLDLLPNLGYFTVHPGRTYFSSLLHANNLRLVLIELGMYIRGKKFGDVWMGTVRDFRISNLLYSVKFPASATISKTISIHYKWTYFAIPWFDRIRGGRLCSFLGEGACAAMQSGLGRGRVGSKGGEGSHKIAIPVKMNRMEHKRLKNQFMY